MNKEEKIEILKNILFIPIETACCSHESCTGFIECSYFNFCHQSEMKVPCTMHEEDITNFIIKIINGEVFINN